MGTCSSRHRAETAAANSALTVFAVQAQNALHSSSWVILRGHVFDLTVFAAQHPGGESQILAGNDCCEATCVSVNFNPFIYGCSCYKRQRVRYVVTAVRQYQHGLARFSAVRLVVSALSIPAAAQRGAGADELFDAYHTDAYLGKLKKYMVGPLC